jgi:serine/threonine protein kinase
MNTLDHPNILKLHNYSYLFVQENHGDPFCKFFLVFEYCESSLVVEMQKLKQLKKILPKKMLLKMTIQLVEALKFL